MEGVRFRGLHSLKLHRELYNDLLERHFDLGAIRKEGCLLEVVAKIFI